jgi:hypothetical protein
MITVIYCVTAIMIISDTSILILLLLLIQLDYSITTAAVTIIDIIITIIHIISLSFFAISLHKTLFHNFMFMLSFNH